MAQWLHQLRQRADAAPSRPREPLRLASPAVQIGTIEPELARRMVAAGLSLCATDDGWRIDGPADAALEQLARWLSAQGLASRWRNELLAVDATDGTPAVARVERAAVRPLGIATHAVHLIGRSAEGGYWVQQRALDKSTDPGLWDTLMGGLVCAGETIEQTLERETWEEAGLRPSQLEALRSHGRVTVRRPLREGYMIEHIHVYEATLMAGALPVNQDGEVARFDCMDPPTLLERLRADAFTLEAALVLAHPSGPLNVWVDGPGPAD
jgi:8-oxo-dGTP pyrophosphatase MutT (NUDIX family)